MTNQDFKNQDGYIALISAIIISVIVLAMTFVLSTSGFFARFNVLDTESKKLSVGLADAAIEKAILNLAQNINYTPAGGGECVSVNDTCGVSGAIKIGRICSVATSGSQKTILARAVFNKAYTNLIVKVTLNVNNFSINSWEEAATYSGPSCSVP